MTDVGGGASRTTEAAAGSSAPTDVSLREFVAAQLHWLDRHMTAEIAALRRESETAIGTADRAVRVAAEEAKERLDAHNGLLQKMEDQAALFAAAKTLEDYKETNNERLGRLERFHAWVLGALFIISLIGAANFIKVWTGG